MNDAIARLKRNIDYSFVSGDPVRDRANCARGVLACEPMLSADAVNSFSPQEMEQLVKVLCRHLHSDDLSDTFLAIACLTLLLALMRAQNSSFQPAVKELKDWMVRKEPDSVLRAHLQTRLLTMPHRYVMDVLTDALARVR